MKKQSLSSSQWLPRLTWGHHSVAGRRNLFTFFINQTLSSKLVFKYISACSHQWFVVHLLLRFNAEQWKLLYSLWCPFASMQHDASHFSKKEQLFLVLNGLIGLKNVCACLLAWWSSTKECMERETASKRDPTKKTLRHYYVAGLVWS